jgi:L-ascorbate metabolism protein UlaG (beta-lactamase superfamily)
MMKTAINVIYLGGPTVILEVGGLRVMTDPTLDPSGSQFPVGLDVFIEKLSEPAIKDIGKIDYVLLSHDQHGDNLDKAGRELLNHVTQTLSTQIASERLGGSVVGLAPWESKSIHTPDGTEILITATPARHGPTNIEKLAGDVIGFVLTIKGEENIEIYFTGDTVFYDGIKEVAQKFNPKYVFIYAGAAKPYVPFNLTMGSNDAVDTAFAFPNSTIIPIHFEGWSHYSETGELLIQSFTALGIIDRFKILPAGQKVELA